MFSLPSLSFSLPWTFRKRDLRVIDIPSVHVYDIDKHDDRRARTLKHLLKLNHANHSILFNELRFHNHMPHLLGSSYILGSSEQKLENIYDDESKTLEKWNPSPGEITVHDWRDYLGDRRYQRAYVDFFEDEVVSKGYKWTKVVEQYLFEGNCPLIHNVISGLGHPLIHLGYAFEFSSREVAMEALGLAATCYNFLHKYLDDPSYTKPSKSPANLEAVLDSVRNDKRFNKIFDHKGSDNIEVLFESHEDLVMEYWNAWDLQQPKEQFEESQKVAAILLCGTQGFGNEYDFFLVHLLTTSHAVRILLPVIPSSWQIALVRQWWLLALTVYICQLRPNIDIGSILDYDTRGKRWDYAVEEAVIGPWSGDAHFVKAIRAMEQASNTWKREHELYLKAAIKLCEQFQGWGGLGGSETIAATAENF